MTRNVLSGRFLALTVLLSLATMAAAQTTTTELDKGPSTVTTYELRGEVAYVEGNSLVVKMSSGDVRTFNVPESRRFIVDGKELTVHELKPGTQLTATVTTTTTPVTVRTKTIGSGTVWFVMGQNVILTLPNGENKQYIVKDDTRFTVDGRPATVHDLRKGMVVAAEKVVEEPAIELATDTRVVGQAPPQAVPAAEPVPAVAQGEAQAPPPAAAETAPPSAEPTERVSAAAETAPPPAEPARRFPLVVVLGLLLVAVVFGIWMMRSRKSGDARS